MSQDDKETAASPGHDDAHVDRDDDDFGEFFIDGDEPTPNREDSDPDPGYAAFSDDFDDPLADWPGPDPSRGMALGEGDPPPDDQAGTPEADADDVENPEDEETAPENRELAFPDDDGDGDGDNDEQSTYAPSASDSDDVGPADADNAEDFLPEDFLPENKDAQNYSDSDDVDDGRWSDDAAQTDEDIVDDFLADLDEPDTTPGLQAVAPAPHSLDPLATAAVTAGAVQRWAEEGPETNGNGASTAAAPDSADNGRRIPLFMIVMVVAALALLAAGGYGVMQQRNALQGEIRDLQARLATAPSPSESVAAREELRAMEVASERLEDELEILRAENQSLQENLATLASTSESAGAADADIAVTNTRANTDTGADTSAGPATSATNPAPSASAFPAGAATGADEQAAVPVAPAETWFVNFGSYTRRVVAEQWSEQLDVTGGEVIVQTAEAGGRAVYRVRVTGLPDRDTAERVATGLEREFQLPRLWIGRE